MKRIVVGLPATDFSPEDGPFIKNVADSKLVFKPYILVIKTLKNPDDITLDYFFEKIKSAIVVPNMDRGSYPRSIFVFLNSILYISTNLSS
ncbi:MAG: hypothetical protein ACQEXX_12185 [Bacillota bacterium]